MSGWPILSGWVAEVEKEEIIREEVKEVRGQNIEIIIMETEISKNDDRHTIGKSEAELGA